MKSDLVPPFCTFAGKCLSSDDQSQVRGDGFACVASSLEEVHAKMKASVYNTQVDSTRKRKRGRGNRYYMRLKNVTGNLGLVHGFYLALDDGAFE